MKQTGVSKNQLQFLEQYFSQERIAEIAGISPRYQRLIKEGKRSGAKYREVIQSLYDMVRTTPAPPRKRRRPPRKKPALAYVHVPDMMNVLFSIFEPRTFKSPRLPYQHRQTGFFLPAPAWTGGLMNTWDSFFIVFGIIPEGDARFKKYRRVMEEEPIEEDEEEEFGPQPEEADSLEMFLWQISRLSDRERDLISHLGLEEKISALQDEIPEGVPVFVNFWISRVTTPLQTAEQSVRQMEDIAIDSVEIANTDSEDVQYFFAGVYGFSGWVRE